MIHSDSKAQTYWRMAGWLLIVLSLWVGIPILAQSNRGTLIGTVNDANGAFIPGAALSLKETNTGSAIPLRRLRKACSVSMNFPREATPLQ